MATKTFCVRKSGDGVKKTKGEHVKLKGYPGLKLFIHKEYGNFVISEYNTGYAICRHGKTKKEVKSNCKKYLDHLKDKDPTTGEWKAFKWDLSVGRLTDPKKCKL